MIMIIYAYIVVWGRLSACPQYTQRACLRLCASHEKLFVILDFFYDEEKMIFFVKQNLQEIMSKRGENFY